MLKKLFAILFTAVAVSCSSDDPINDDGTLEPPVPNQDKTEKVAKQKGLWVGGSVNFTTVLNSKENTDKYLKLCKATGITFLYMDVMGPNGYALCNVDALAPYSERPYDVFEYVLTKCDEYGIDVVASLTPLNVGDQRKKKGVFYDSDRWVGKTQCRKINPDNGAAYNILNIEDDLEADIIMLEPSIKEVKDYCVELCAQVVQNYKHHKSFRGLSLDYVRYSNAAPDGGWYGYGDQVVKNFTAMMGIAPDDQNDFISKEGGFGKYFAEWVYFRSMSVAEVIRAISKKCKEVMPECEMHLWASAQWSSRYSVGQNWAASSYVPTGRQYLDGYEKTSFTDALDVFSLGAYASDIYIKDNPASDWTVENFVTTYQTYIPKNHKCKVWASVPSYAYSLDHMKMRDAVLLCLQHTDGVSIFELCHVRNNNHWSAIKQGFELSGY